MSSRTVDDVCPIIYVRGYAGSQRHVEDTVDEGARLPSRTIARYSRPSHSGPAYSGGFKLHWVREEMVGRRRGEGWEIVVVADDGRRVTFKVPPGMPSVDPSALNPDEAPHVSPSPDHRIQCEFTR